MFIKRADKLTGITGLLGIALLLMAGQIGRSQNVVAWGSNTGGQITVPANATNVIGVAAGWYHSLALRNDGSVVSWGQITTVPLAVTNIVRIAAGASNNLALRGDGKVFAWGNDNSWGEDNVPAFRTNVIAIAAGDLHCLALQADGTVIAWGQNIYGQTNVPAGLTNVIAISAGTMQSMALKDDGTMVIWGGGAYPVPRATEEVAAMAAGSSFNLYLNASGGLFQEGYFKVKPPKTATNIVAIATGANFSLALRNNGTLLGWGSISATNPPASATNIIAMAVGLSHGLAVRGDGSPHLLGSAAYRLFSSVGNLLPFYARAVGASPISYQWLVDGVPIDGATNANLATPIGFGTQSNYYQVEVCNGLGCATSSVVNLTVTALNIWGNNLDGQCNVPRSVINPVTVVSGAYHCLALQPDGSVVAWGRNWSHQTNVPAGVTNVVMLAGGSDHCLALRNDGSVIAWGNNGGGQTNVPAAASNVVAVAAGWAHSLALRADGTVIAWGDNSYEQTNVPANLTDVIAIAAGYYHSLALRSDHSVVVWGSQYLVPSLPTNVVAIAAGCEHSLVLTGDGRVIAWGDNTYGQCSVPASVTNAIAIKAGYGHSLAELSDGTVVAWGKVYPATTNVPPGLGNVATIACGEDHEMALAGYGMPQIQLEPQTTTVHVGASGLLKADPAGSYPIAYQWFQDSSPISGATNSWLLLDDIQQTNAGSYTLIASNSFGQTTSAAVNYGVDPSPYFLTPWPTVQNSLAGSSLSLGVNAGGAQPLSYQAQLNGVNLTDGANITGSESSNVLFSPAGFADNGTLNWIVTNSFGAYTGLVATVAITPVVGWGDNSSGQLQIPALVTNVVSIASGGDHNLALLANGTLAAWGDNTYNQNSIPASATNIVAIAEGETHSLALRADGTVIAWGDNSSGQTNVPAGANGAVAIAGGNGISQALMPNGSVVMWGKYVQTTYTGMMQISTRGNNTLLLRNDGVLVQSGLFLPISQAYSNIVAICAAVTDNLVLQANGTLIAWGYNVNGETKIPPSATNVVAIAGGDDHFLALRADGTVIAWGNTNFSQTTVPPLNQSIGLVAAGSVHSLAVLGSPAWQTAVAGNNVTFSAAQYANRKTTFQWQFNGVNISGATNSTLTLTDVNWTNTGSYRAIITYPTGSITSPNMTLNVPRSPLLFSSASLSYEATNGAFQMLLTGSSGVYPVVFYTSTDLVNWVPVYTNPPTTNVIDFTNVPPTATPQMFYRAAEQP